MSSGIYISVPFCRSKCTFCNFASGVFSRAQIGCYVQRLAEDIAAITDFARAQGSEVPENADSVYLGGGTPSLLQPAQLRELFSALRKEFALALNSEITVECAPGTIHDELMESLASCGVNRVSLGVQSFIDQEAASVGRLHTRAIALSDMERLRAAGLPNINLDLIAGLPHQTEASWIASLEQAIATGVPHVSVYMLEVDEDSRLGRELIAGGRRYHAHFVPDDDRTAAFYEIACSRLEAAGIRQYEISNFARAGFESQHNLKYWLRQPYLGFGLDAHSMLPASQHYQTTGIESLRFSTTDSLEQFLLSSGVTAAPVTMAQALEESFFLGLRLNRGIDLKEIRERFGAHVGAKTGVKTADVDQFLPAIKELIANGLLETDGTALRLTPRGRLLSNEVFQNFVREESVPSGDRVIGTLENRETRALRD